MATKKKGKAAKGRSVKRSASKPKSKAKSGAKKSPARRAGGGGLSLRDASPSFTVNDLQRSLTFYRDVLGFKVDEKWEDNGVLRGVSFTAGKVTLMIGQDDWKKGRDRMKGQGVRMYFETETNVDALAEGIAKRGGTLESLPEDRPWGYRDFSMADPDGFKLTFGAPVKKRT
jgi:uncharacterized glyoxalase superfamily protein PhnB